MGRRPGPGLTRDHVVAAALRLVEEEGVEALGVSRVARSLGIKPPSLYNHVGKGDALARAVALEGTRGLLAAYRSADDTGGPLDRLRALVWATRRWALENPALYALMARVPPDNEAEDAGPVIRSILAQFAEPLSQLGVPDAETVHAIRGLRASVHGFLLLETSHQFGLAEDPEESFRWMVDALLRGVVPGATATN